MQIKIGIVNCVTGKIVKEKTVEQEVALKEAEKMSKWFDKQETFFSKAIWEHWVLMGTLYKFLKLADGSSYNDLAVESIAVFKNPKARGEEHEFYMQRRKN